MTRPPTLGERLRAAVVNQCGLETLTCEFAPGGKLHGVGIPSELYCQTCGHMRLWHDVAAAAAVVATSDSVALD